MRDFSSKASLRSERDVSPADPPSEAPTQRFDTSLDECLTRHWARLCSIVAYRANAELLNRYAVEDLAQETALRALESRDSFAYQGETEFARWIATVARRVVSDSGRELNAGAQTSGLALTRGSSIGVSQSHVVAPDSTPSVRAIRNQELQRIVTALAGLSELDREAIVQVKLECRSIGDCAAEFGCSYHAVIQRLSHGMKHLGQALRGDV